jgi:hypothetical protein
MCFMNAGFPVWSRDFSCYRPDQPHGHLGREWLAASLADLNYWRPDLKSWPRWSSTRYSIVPSSPVPPGGCLPDSEHKLADLLLQLL